MNVNKKQIKKILCSQPVAFRFAAYKTRYIPRIFMYHRFSARSHHDVPIVAASNFEWQLQQLSGQWNVIPLKEYVFYRRKQLEIPPYTVIITVDDGYRDFCDVAYPLLCKYNLPATFFVTTLFVDGAIWLWPDRLRYALKQTKISSLEVSLGSRKLELRTSTRMQQDRSWQYLSDYCIGVPDREKWHLIKSLERQLKVVVPETPPREFASASWGQLKEMAHNGIEIGGHTMTHPVLSRVAPSCLHYELVNSKEIIEEKIGIAVETLCYPNGSDGDITSTVLKIVQDNSYCGAVQGTGIDFSDLYRLPRLSVSNNRLDFLWKLYGFEQFFLK